VGVFSVASQSSEVYSVEEGRSSVWFVIFI
jgi:hypothetical protein